MGGVCKLVENAGKSAFTERYFDDIYPQYYNFYSIRKMRALENVPIADYIKNTCVAFSFNETGAFRNMLYKGMIYTDECLYVHFQKRPVKIECDLSISKFILIPNRVINEQKITENFLFKHCKYTTIYPYYIRIRIFNLLKKFKAIVRGAK